jgi:uncharacterized membrane protein
MKNSSIFNKLVGYLLRGLLFVAPLAFTFMVIEAVFNWIDGLLPVDIPGLGLLIILGVLVGVGYLGSTYFMKPIFDLFERFISKIPLLSLVYNSIKDLLGAFVGEKRKFNKPVIVQFDKDGNIMKPGFITQEDLSSLELPGYCSVYLPHSYNFSGNIIIVKRELVRAWDANGTEAMKFIVSGGVSHVD